MKQITIKRPPLKGTGRFYQAVVLWPIFSHGHREWYHGETELIGPPRTSAQVSHRDIDAFVELNKQSLAQSKREAKKDRRDIEPHFKVKQIWPEPVFAK